MPQKATENLSFTTPTPTVLIHGEIYRVGNEHVRTNFCTEFPRSKFNPTASFQQELVFPRVEFPSYARMLVMRYSERIRGYQFDGVCVRFLGYCDIV